MIKSAWVMVGILIFLLSLAWVIKNNIKELTRIVGITAFATLGYTLIIMGVLVSILFIIKWFIKNKDTILS